MAIRALLLTCLQILTIYKYNVLRTKTIDIHMSNLDEETKRILAEVEPDAQSGSNDSKENNKSKKKDTNVEENNFEDPDSEW